MAFLNFSIKKFFAAVYFGVVVKMLGPISQQNTTSPFAILIKYYANEFEANETLKMFKDKFSTQKIQQPEGSL